jgi:glycerophosphoryl diester phosphodiesterase
MRGLDKLFYEKLFVVIGHRGAAGLAPENTIAGVLKAIEVGADAVEIDVQKTVDDVMIVVHDEDLSRVAGTNINVRNVRYKDLENIRVSGEKIPTLEEVLTVSIDKIFVFIEIKNRGDEEKTLDVIRSVGASDRVAIISFYEEPLIKIKRYSPNIPVGIIYYQPPGKIIDAKKSGFELVLPRYPLATEKSIEFAHRIGLRMIAWTVNDEKWIRELASRKIDGITTDYPDKAVKIRRELSKTI